MNTKLETLIAYWEIYELAYDEYLRPNKPRVTETIAALRQADQQAQPVIIRPPFQREITVIMRPERGAKEADDAIDCIKKGGTIFIIDPPELYFHQLRLRVAQDPSLERRIAVFYLREDQVMQEVGLKFEDELLWPVGFLRSGWETETKINAVRQRVTSPPAPQARELSDEEIEIAAKEILGHAAFDELGLVFTVDDLRQFVHYFADRAIRPAAGMVSDQQDAARFRHMMDESGKWFCEEAYPAMMVGRLREVCDAAMIAAAQEPRNG